jgi:hypothetical protein
MKGQLATCPVAKGHHKDSGSNPLIEAAPKRSEFMSICMRATQAKGVNNQLYILTGSLQEEEEPQLERAVTGARPHLARPKGST